MSKEQPGPRGFTMAEEDAPRALPPMTFQTLVLSLSTSAMVHLGASPGPELESGDVNLPLAKQTIDILELLRTKTRGNLEPEESELLENVLHEVHLKYVEARRVQR